MCRVPLYMCNNFLSVTTQVCIKKVNFQSIVRMNFTSEGLRGEEYALSQCLIVFLFQFLSLKSIFLECHFQRNISLISSCRR